MRTFESLIIFTTVLAGLSLGAHADSKPKDETAEPSLLSVPVNSRTLKRETQASLKSLNRNWDGFSTPEDKAQWPVSAFSELKPACEAGQHGCYLIEYLDPEKLAQYPKFEGNEDTENALMQDQEFFLDHLLGKYIPADERCQEGDHFNWWVLAFGGNVRVPKYFSCAQRAATFFPTPDGQKRLASQAIAKATSELVQGEALAQETIQGLFDYPLSFGDLPKLYREVDVPSTTPVRVSLESVLRDALLLTTEALTNSANSRLSTYGYRNDDLITSGHFLTSDEAFRRLEAIGRVPEIVSLTPELRSRLGKAFQETDSSGAWKTLAAYSPNKNLIYVDLTGDFYEAVYAFQHELWHAFIENSTSSQAYRDQVQMLIDSSNREESLAKTEDERQATINKADDALKNIIFFKMIEDELDAIMSSNLLYHYAGHLTSAWGGHSPSAKAWHDQFSADLNLGELYLPRSFRLDTMLGHHSAEKYAGSKKAATLNALGTATVLSAFAFPPMLIVGFPVMMAEQEHTEAIKNKLHSQDQALDQALKQEIAAQDAIEANLSGFWQKLVHSLPSEMKIFSRQYFLKLPDFKEYMTPSELNSIQLAPPRPVQLTCEQAKRIADLMPEEYEHGIPFAFQITDTTPCEIGDGTHPGEGSGSHPDISAVPCLRGDVK